MIRYSRIYPEKAKVLWSRHLPRKNCARAKKGNFIDISGGGTAEVTRTATEQFEHKAGMGEMRLSIRWIDECTYQLFNRKVLSGIEPSFPMNPKDTITVHIVSSDDEGFNYEARTSSMDIPMTGRQLYHKSSTPTAGTLHLPR
jgi:hypothetical protein